MQIPSMRVDGKVALITGAGSGLGQGFSLALAQAGADVVITELPGKEHLGEETARQVRESGRKAWVVALDVTQVSMIRAVVDGVIAQTGGIDILVNNAGINIPQLAVDVTEEAWDKVLDVDLKGNFFMAQAVGKHMIEQGKGGKIINISSQMGVLGYVYRAAYCSAKAGVVNLTRVLAFEWAKHNIQVNAIGPTFVLTPLTAPFWENKAFYDDVISRIPMGRLAKVEDIVGACVYLASPAADMVTGHTLLVDGGWTAV